VSDTHGTSLRCENMYRMMHGVAVGGYKVELGYAMTPLRKKIDCHVPVEKGQPKNLQGPVLCMDPAVELTAVPSQNSYIVQRGYHAPKPSSQTPLPPFPCLFLSLKM